MSTDFFVVSKNVAHKPEDLPVARRRFYQKLFSDSWVCYSMAKRWTCFWLEPSAISSADGAWAMLLPLRYGAVHWRALSARDLNKTAHSTLQISALLISLSLLLPSPSTSTQTHLHEQAFKFLLKHFKTRIAFTAKSLKINTPVKKKNK